MEQKEEEKYYTIKFNVEHSEVQWNIKVPNDANKLDKIRLTVVDDIPKIRSNDLFLNIYMETYGILWLRIRNCAYKYKCLVCGITKRATHQIFGHLMKDHIKKRQYNCSLCEKKFFSNRKLKAHFQNVHCKSERINTYHCPKCNKGYVSLKYFVKHLEAETKKNKFFPFR